jgi:hypothetical protein
VPPPLVQLELLVSASEAERHVAIALLICDVRH